MYTLPRCQVVIHTRQSLYHPFTTASTLGVNPIVAPLPTPFLFKVKQCTQERARVTQQNFVSGTVEFGLLGGAVDADEPARRREQRRIAKIHLVIQSTTDHDGDIGFFKGSLGWAILVHIGQAHVGLAGFGQQFLMIGNVVHRNRQ